MSIKKVQSTNGEFRWEVRVYENGRGSRRINRRFEKRSDAEKFYFDYQKKIKTQGGFLENCTFDKRRFKEEAEHWLKDSEHRFSPGWLKTVRGYLSEILPRFGDYSIEKFNPEFLTKYQREEKARGLANETVNKKTQVITTILNFSTKQRRIPFNPVTGFSKLNVIKPEMLFWSEAECLSFLNFADQRYPKGSSERWVYIVYLLAINTGMRAGEIWGLKPIDISKDGKTIIVRRQFNLVANDFGPTKGRNQRSVPCNEVLREELRCQIESNGIGDSETIFLNENRRPICHRNFSDRKFQKDLDLWGGRCIRFHDLRHTAATLLISRGVDIKTVKEICGHSDIQTTMNYSHLIAGSIEKVAMNFVIAPGKEVAK